MRMKSFPVDGPADIWIMNSLIIRMDFHGNGSDPLSVEIGYGQSLTFRTYNGHGRRLADPDSFNALIEDIETPLPNTLAGNKQTYLRLIRKQSNLYGDRLKASKKCKKLTSYPQ